MADRHYHNDNVKGATYDVEIGDEIVTYQRVECTCGQGIRNDIIARRPKPKDK